MTTLRVKRGLKGLLLLFSDTSLTKKAYLNSLAAALEYGARVVVGFIVIPYLVAGLGTNLFGILLTLRKMTGYLTAAGARPTQALKCVIANRQSVGDDKEKRQHVGSAIVVALLFLPLQLAFGALVIWFAPIWLHDVPEKHYWLVRVATGLLVMGLVLRNFVNLPRSVLEGENLGYKRIGLSTALVILGGGLTLLALYLDTGLRGVAAANLITVIVTGVLFVLMVRTYVPWFGASIPSGQMVWQFVGLSWWFLLWRLIMQVLANSDLVILGILAPAETVTIFALAKYLPEMLIEFVAIVVFGITPGLGGLIGSGKIQTAAKVRGEFMLMTWLIVTVSGATILLWNDTFLSLWMGPEFRATTSLTLMILLMVTQLALIRNDANVIDLTLDLRHKVLLGALSATATIGIAVLLVGWFGKGVAGLCAAFIAGRFLLSVCYPVMVGRLLEVPWRSQVVSLVRPTFTTVILLALLIQLKEQDIMIVGSWMGLAVAVLSTLGVVSVVTFYVGLTTSQRGQILYRVRKVISDKRDQGHQV